VVDVVGGVQHGRGASQVRETDSRHDDTSSTSHRAHVTADDDVTDDVTAARGCVP